MGSTQVGLEWATIGFDWSQRLKSLLCGLALRLPGRICFLEGADKRLPVCHEFKLRVQLAVFLGMLPFEIFVILLRRPAVERDISAGIFGVAQQPCAQVSDAAREELRPVARGAVRALEFGDAACLDP